MAEGHPAVTKYENSYEKGQHKQIKQYGLCQRFKGQLTGFVSATGICMGSTGDGPLTAGGGARKKPGGDEHTRVRGRGDEEWNGDGDWRGVWEWWRDGGMFVEGGMLVGGDCDEEVVVAAEPGLLCVCVDSCYQKYKTTQHDRFL